MKVILTSQTLTKQAADAWLLFVFENDTWKAPDGDPLARRLQKMVADSRKVFPGKRNETLWLPSWQALPARSLLLVGLGPRKEFHVGRLWQAAASAGRTLRDKEVETVAASLSLPSGLERLGPARFAEVVAEGMQYGFYRFTRFLTKKEKDQRPNRVVFTDASAGLTKRSDEWGKLAKAWEAFETTRDLANMPANEATPADIARAARQLARRYGLACRVLSADELAREGCNAFLAVGRGSRNPPCLITLRYGGTKRALAPVVLIGKTITFDAGGLSLKRAEGLEWMKYDKCGGMAVLAAVLMAKCLELERPVVAMLAAAENLPSGTATRPGDIVRARSGKTIEILNTDAEGRLVLADTLSLAAEYKPAAIVDLATLTGASIVALGHVLCAVMGNHNGLVEQLREAGERCGERLWPLPLLPEYEEDLRGVQADLKNISNKGAGTIIGGAFLKQFVPAGVPWAHLDIANVAWVESPQPYAPPGPTLFGARLLIEWLRRYRPPS